MSQSKLRDLIIETSANVLSHAFIVKNIKHFMKSLYEDDAVQERISTVMVAGNSYQRFAGCQMTRLSDWDKHNLTRYERRDRPTLNIQRIEQPEEPSSIDSPPIVKNGRMKIERHTDIKIHSVINIHAWDQAGWSGTAFIQFDPSYPPVLALMFKDEEAARHIFTEWQERVGTIDKENAIHVAVIRDYNPLQPNHYMVQVAPSPVLESLRRGKSAFIASRHNEMRPKNDTNLALFLKTYREKSAYYLGVAILKPSGSPAFIDDLLILKRELSIKTASEIGELDIEAMTLRTKRNATDEGDEED